MQRKWPIKDGPAGLGPHDVGQTRTMTIQLSDKRMWQCLIDILSVENKVNPHRHTFTGRLHVQREIVPVTGTYNSRLKNGHCQTTAST